ncbi:MAG: SGNH/GDSL hydrolase family protein [Lachnospiraceae bacterium]|nr:SGNH/GDSL hydrolase family protein [Lachnospiraceae bacterium]
MKKKNDLAIGIILILLVGGLCYFLIIKSIMGAIGEKKQEPVDSVVAEISEQTVSQQIPSIEEIPSVEDTSSTETVPSTDMDNPEDTSVSYVKDDSDEYVDTFIPQITTTAYQAFEGCDFVFLGDSIFENNDGPYSIPNMVAAYTKARTYNISRGGMCSSFQMADWCSMQEATEAFLSQYTIDEHESDVMDRDLQKFFADDHTNRELYIFFDCCINDYSMATPLEADGAGFSFEDAYRTCIERIMDVYPEAHIITSVPMYHEAFSLGMDLNGRLHVEQDYVNAVHSVSDEKHLPCIDLRFYTSITADNCGKYLKDGLHPNNEGCLIIAEAISKVTYDVFRRYQ